MNMGEHIVPVLLITANVGSVFENVSKCVYNLLKALHDPNVVYPVDFHWHAVDGLFSAVVSSS